VFGVEDELAGNRRRLPCFLPNEVLGTSAEMLTRPGKR
jgi:hypothetical protein